jgi:hypothetical protein
MPASADQQILGVTKLKTIALFVILSTIFCLASFAQDPEPDPAYLWTEKVQLQAGQTINLVKFIEGRPGGGFFALCDSSVSFQLNTDTKTSYVAFFRNSTAVVTALVDFELTIRAIE